MLAISLGFPAGAAEIIFSLVPEHLWGRKDLPLDAVALPAATIYLYRHGEYVPSLTLDANTAHVVPPGTWHWIGEAPGFVTIADGILRVSDDSDLRKTIVWEAIPACELQLSDGDWSRFSRIDVVSLESGTTHPITPAQRRTMAVPVGRFILYGVGPSGITGIAAVEKCGPGEERVARMPRAPLKGRQHIMASATVPKHVFGDDVDGVASVDLGPLSLELVPANGRAILPDASVRVGDRVAAFFLDVPATEALPLFFRHPELMTHSEVIHPIAGEIHELEEARLRERATVKLLIDYRPQDEHRTEQFVALACGAESPEPVMAVSRRGCLPSAAPIPLRRGVHEYEIGSLDLGWYLLEATVDDEVIPGLGAWSNATVGPTGPTTITLDPVLLEELHIYGHLLVDDDPVPGYVLLEPYENQPERRFATSEHDLLYHIYYFGQMPTAFDLHRLPEALRQRPAEELRGLYFGYQTRACDADGFCRLYDLFSKFSGSGRLDFDLGTGRRFLVRVLDAADDEPIPSARVNTSVRGLEQNTIQFVDGEEYANPNADAQYLMTLTDGKGEVRLRNLEDEGSPITVTKEGYKRFQGRLTPSTEPGELVVRLEPLQETGRLRFKFSDGSPAARSFLLTLDPSGEPDYRCSKPTNIFGEVDVPEECVVDPSRSFAFLHPEAPLQLFSGSDLRNARELTVSKGSSLPIRIRLVDEAHRPIADTPIVMKFADLVVGPNHFLIASTHTGHDFPFRTNAAGEIDVSMVGPQGMLPELAIFGERVWVAIPATRPHGAPIELIVKRN